MTFEGITVGISAFLYACVGISFLVKGQYAWSLVWICYSLANFGLILVKK
jgi:hypothetical protein